MALTLVLTKNITIFCFAMLWTIVNHQNNVAKSSLGPNKDVAFPEVWVRVSSNSFVLLLALMTVIYFNEDPPKKNQNFKKSEKILSKKRQNGGQKVVILQNDISPVSVRKGSSTSHPNFKSNPTCFPDSCWR